MNTNITMDATTSFQYIVDNLPSWKEQTKSLSTYTSQKTEEFKAEYARLVSKAKPKRIKSPSICSIHTDNEDDQKDTGMKQDTTPLHLDPVEISPFEAGNRYIYAQATKKRKPGTSFRSGASGPMKFRSKHMAVIYYDSYVQEQLESLVKSIGGSRNNLRKGKMSYTITKGLQLPSLSRKYDMSSSVTGSDGMRSSSAYRNGMKLPMGKSETNITTEVTGEAAFKEADKELETCQNLCETAAHQFLRDGDCRLELDTVVRNLDTILDLAKTTLELFKAEEKQEESTTESTSATGSMSTESDATLVEKSSQEGFNPLHKLAPTPHALFTAKRPSLPNTNSAPPVMTEIEVDDDSDQSSIEIDVSKYRMASRAANRGRVRV